jgi:hypothetical protein
MRLALAASLAATGCASVLGIEYHDLATDAGADGSGEGDGQGGLADGAPEGAAPESAPPEDGPSSLADHHNGSLDGAAPVDASGNWNISCDASAGTAMDAGYPLPLVVTNYFGPTGWFGDGTGVTLVPKVAGDSVNCNGMRSQAALGICYSVTFTPLTGTATGIFWQYPNNNWGTMPGLRIAAGAKNVSFYAKGASGGEAVSFIAGGINDGQKYSDTFQEYLDVTLTASWVEYTIPLPPCYGPVLGGFAWDVIPPAGSTKTISFQIDSIVWH